MSVIPSDGFDFLCSSDPCRSNYVGRSNHIKFNSNTKALYTNNTKVLYIYFSHSKSSRPISVVNLYSSRLKLLECPPKQSFGLWLGLTCSMSVLVEGKCRLPHLYSLLHAHKPASVNVQNFQNPEL